MGSKYEMATSWKTTVAIKLIFNNLWELSPKIELRRWNLKEKDGKRVMGSKAKCLFFFFVETRFTGRTDFIVALYS
jgi:hypothetical protein